jgi:hypothetical protein
VWVTTENAVAWLVLLIYFIFFKVLHFYMRRWQRMMLIKQTRPQNRMSREDVLKTTPKVSMGELEENHV